MCKISNKEVNKRLVGKLSESDIEIASTQCSKSAMILEHNLNILISRSCKGCLLENCKERTVTVGNTSAKVMIIGSTPSETDAKGKIPFFDDNGRFITVILDKLGLTRDNVFMTNAHKCLSDGKDDARHLLCSQNYLVKEITMVMPDVIFVFGEIGADAISYHFKNLTRISDYSSMIGKVETINVIGLKEIKVLYLRDIEEIVSAVGALYNKYKVETWTNIKNFMDGEK